MEEISHYSFEESGEEIQALIDDVKTPDAFPVENSSRLVTSGGVSAALAMKADKSSFVALTESEYQQITPVPGVYYFIYED